MKIKENIAIKYKQKSDLINLDKSLCDLSKVNQVRRFIVKYISLKALKK